MDQIDEIKSKIDIVEFIGSYITLKKTGRNVKALCPFHIEKTPSFTISPERQIWHCFGCGEGGDVFGFLMKYENIEFKEALQILAEKAGVKLEKVYAEAGRSKKDIFLAINLLAAEFFHYVLLKDPIGKRALEYLKNRQINSESIQSFKLGYAPQSWDALGNFLHKKNHQIADAGEAGLLIAKSGGRGFYDRFRGRLMFPIFSPLGAVLGFSGRVLVDTKDEPKYVNTPETPVFFKSQVLYGLNLGRDDIKKQNEAIVVEGNLDVVSSYQAGVKNAVAPLGSALTLEQVRTLKRYTDRLAFCFDADSAGQEASRRAIDVAEQAGMSIKIIQIKGAKDPDELIRQNPDLWRESITKTIPVYDFLLGLSFNKYDASSTYGRKKIGEEGIQILASISDRLTQSHYVKKLSESLGINEEAVLEAIKKNKPEKSQTNPITDILEKATVGGERRRMVEEYLLSLLLKYGGITLKPARLAELTFQAADLQAIWSKLREEGKGRFHIRAFCDKLKPELVKRVDELYLKDWGEEEGEADKELETTLKILEEITLRDSLQTLSQEIGEAETAGEEKKVQKLAAQFGRLSDKLAEVQTE